jgi:gluconate 2-dehydrogenase gamma chain
MIPSRRNFLKSAGLAAATVSTSPAALAANPPAEKSPYTFLTPEEAAFVEAATARLIPADEAGPGAVQADVPNYIDKQLGDAWGAGERLYRSGPWRQGEPTQGYQLPFTPAELFRNACRALRDETAKGGGAPFETRDAQAQDAYLRDLQESKRDLNGVPANVFFESLWALTVEGFLSDPVYGGNKDMISWKMIGFPGAYATYYHLVDQHGVAFNRAPMSLAQDGRGVIHIHPEVSASTGNAQAGMSMTPGQAPPAPSSTTAVGH